MSDAESVVDSAPQEEQQATAIEAVKYDGSAVVLDPIELVLVDLEKRHKDVVFDLTTTKGDKAARQARKELVQVRTGAENAYKAWNAPLLAEQRKARERVADIQSRVKLLEEPIDAQIKADEARREAERIERERIEAERVAKIRERINNIANVPTLAVDMGSAEIQAVIEDIMAMDLTEERFGESLAEAQDTAARVHEKLQQMYESALRREEHAEALRKQQEELERARAEIAAQQAELERQRREQEEAAAAAEILRAEAARQAAEKAARDAEDLKRAAAGQTDAFPDEKAKAIDVVKADIQERRASSSVAEPATKEVAPASIAGLVRSRDDDESQYIAARQEIDAMEADAAARHEEEINRLREEAAAAAAAWKPDARFVVDVLADACEVDAAQALEWLQSISFAECTVESLQDGK